MRHIEEIVVVDIGGQFGPRMVQARGNGVALLLERQQEGAAAVERHGDLRMARLARVVLVEVEVDDLPAVDERSRGGGRMGAAGGHTPRAALGHGHRIGCAGLSGQHEAGFVLVAARLERRRLRVEEQGGKRPLAASVTRRAACAEGKYEDHHKERTTPGLQHPVLQCHLQKMERKNQPPTRRVPRRGLILD